MDILKRFWFPIVCGVLALVAFILTIFPLQGWVSGVEKSLKEQAGTYTQLDGLLTRNRTLPVLSVDGGEAIRLTEFPTNASIERARTAAEAVAGSAKRMLTAAVEMNAKKPLVPGALPEAPAQDRFRFRDAYRDFMNSTLPTLLGAAAPPSEADLQAEKDRIWARDYAPKIVVGPNGPLNEEQKRQEFDQETETLADRFRRDWASRHRVYLEKDTLSTAVGIDGATAPHSAAIWDAQLLMWIQTDVLGAIQAANSESTSILDAPVKHVAELQVDTQPVLPPTAAADATGAVPPPPSPTMAVTFDYTVSPTGRVSGGLYDVFPVSIVLNVDAAEIPRILAEFGRNRLVYVRKVNVEAVDLVRAEEAGFFYGDVPVAQLTIDAEVVLLRAWTEPFMPAIVRQTLGLAAPAAGIPG